MTVSNYITIKRLGDEIGMDRSNLRKYVNSLGINMVKIRTPDAGNQLSNAITLEEAKLVKKARQESGFMDVPMNRKGEFYLIVLNGDVPGIRPRVKLGFTTDLENRIQDYRTTNPHCYYVGRWECEKAWEQAAIYAVTNYDGCNHVGGEVYDCFMVEILLKRCDRFFEWFEKSTGGTEF